MWDLLFGEWNGLKQAGQGRSPVIIVGPRKRGGDSQVRTGDGEVYYVLSWRAPNGAGVWQRSPRYELCCSCHLLPGSWGDKQPVSPGLMGRPRREASSRRPKGPTLQLPGV